MLASLLLGFAPQLGPELCPSQTLLPTGAQSGDRTAESLALHGDHLVAGAPAADDTWGGSGAAIVWRRTAEGSWAELARLDPGPLSAPADFGREVALDANTVAVGAPREKHLPALPPYPTGRVHLFDLATGIETVIANPLDIESDFGEGVAIDGDRLAVGAPRGDLDPAPQVYAERGRVYVFEQQDGAWILQHTIAPSADYVGTDFGTEIVLQGDRMWIGAPGDGTPPPQESGAVYVLELSGGTWQEIQKLKPPAADAFARFGEAFAVHGSRLLVGAPGHDDDEGRAFLFSDDGAGYQLEATFTPVPAIGPVETDRFGAAVALSDEAVAVGAPHDASPLSRSGSVHVFRPAPDGGYTHTGTIAPGGQLADSELGASIVLDGDVLLVGQPESIVPQGPGGPGGRIQRFALEQPLPFVACADSVSLATGGAQVFQLALGSPVAGDLAWLLGSATGTEPGVPLGPFTVPLVVDAYTVFSLTHPNDDPLVASLVSLDADGGAALRFRLPEASDPVLAGTTLHHAALVFHPTTGLPAYVSEAAPLLLEP